MPLGSARFRGAGLARLCRQPSVSAQALGIHEMARLLVEVLREKGFDSQLHPTAGNPIVTARLQSTGSRTLLFYNHYDVQPPEPLEKWTTPPFEPTVREGKLFARGATDNKGNIVSRLAAIEAILAVRGRLPLTVTWLVDGEDRWRTCVLYSNMFSRAFTTSAVCDHLTTACLFCTDQRPPEVFGHDWGVTPVSGALAHAQLTGPGAPPTRRRRNSRHRP